MLAAARPGGPMSTTLMLFRDGGPFMYLILMFGTLALLATVALAIVQTLGRRLPAALWFLLPTMVLGLGTLGTLFGIGQASKAVATVSPDLIATLAAAGAAVAEYTTLFGLGWAAGLLTLSAGALGLGLAVASKDGAWTPLHAAASVPLLVVGLGAAAAAPALDLQASGAWPGVLALLGAFAIALAALRVPGDDAGRVRTAHGRIAVAALVASAVLFAGLAVANGNEMMGYKAVSASDPEFRDEMRWATGVLVGRGRALGWGLAAAAVLLGAIPALPLRQHLGDRRGLVSAGAAGGLVLLSLVALVVTQASQSALWASAAG
jgi:hypothetical protein